MSSHLKHFMAIGLGTIANIVLGLITTPIITRLVDTADYGALSIFNTYTSMAVMVLCLGLDQALIRFYYEDDSIEYKRKIISVTAGIPLFVATVSCILGFLFLNRNDIQFEFKGKILFCLCIYVVVQLFLRFSQLVLRVEYKTKRYAVLNSLNKAIYLIIVIVLFWLVKSEDNLFLLVIATVVSSIVPLVIGVISEKCLWGLNGDKRVKKKIDTNELLKYGFPFILSMGITTLFEALDKLSINHFCSYSEVGIYSSAITIVNVFTIIQTTFNTVWAPMSIEHFTKKPNDKEFFRNVNSIITVVMFVFGCSLIVFKDVFILLLGSKYREASSIIPFLVFHPIMYTISETTAIGIDFYKKSKLHILVALTACISNAIGNYLLVPVFGGKGAAISTGISYIVFFTTRTFLGRKYFNYKPELLKTYLLTLMIFFFALYSSVVKFNYVCGLIYIFCIVAILLLYKETIRQILQFIINKFRNGGKSE